MLRFVFLMMVSLSGLAAGAFGAPPATQPTENIDPILMRKLADGGSGTAFCVEEHGYYATTARVVQGSQTNQALIVRIDTDWDVAFLRGPMVKAVSTLPLGESDKVREMDELVVHGFPAPKNAEDSPPPRSTMVKVTVRSLRKALGETDLIYIDPPLEPGYTGGPVVNKAGKVVGLVGSSTFGGKINQVYPVERLWKLKVITSMRAGASVPYRQRYDPIDFGVTFAPHPLPREPLVVQLTIEDIDGQIRQITERAGDALSHTFTIAPLRKLSHNPGVHIVASFPDGQISGIMPDRSFFVDTREAKFSDVRRIVLDDGVRVEFADKRVVRKKATQLGVVDLRLGGTTAAVNLDRALEITVADAPVERTRIPYTVTLTESDHEIGRLAGTIRIGAKDPNDGLADQRPSPPVPQNPTTIRLPSRVDDLCVGGGGRWIVLHMPEAAKFAIFDVTESRITGLIDAPAREIRFAAGWSKLMVLDLDLKLMQRWDLASQKREASVEYPWKGSVRQVAMGSASDGPLLVVATAESETDPSAGFVFVDPVTMLPLDVRRDLQRNWVTAFGDTVHLRAAPAGEVFGGWAPDDHSYNEGSPYGLMLQAGAVKTLRVPRTAGPIIPDADQGLLLSADGGVFSPGFKRLNPEPPTPRLLVPSATPGYRLSIPLVTDADKARHSRIMAPTLCYLSSQEKAIGEGPDFQYLSLSRQSPHPRFLTVDKRVMFMPLSKLVIVVPEENDRLILHPFDVGGLLAKSNRNDYLFVDSPPPPVAERGKPFRYQLSAVTSHPEAAFTLENGPPGLTVSRTGEIHWTPEAAVKPWNQAPVIVLIVNAKGAQTRYGFNIHLR